MRLYIYKLKKKWEVQLSTHLVWRAVFRNPSLRVNGCFGSTEFPIPSGTDLRHWLHLCPESRAGKACQLQASPHRERVTPRPHQNVRVNKSNQTRRTRGHFVRLHDKLFWVWDYSKEGKLNLFAEVLIEQLFLEFANRDTERKPKFVVQTRSSADKGRWWVYSILGLSKKRGRTRISGPRGLRAGWAGGAPATFVILNPGTPSTWIPPPRMLAPVRPAEGAPSPEGGGTALRRK